MPADPSVLRAQLIEHAEAWNSGQIDRRTTMSHAWAERTAKLLRAAADALAPASEGPPVGKLLQSISARTSERDQAREACAIIDRDCQKQVAENAALCRALKRVAEIASIQTWTDDDDLLKEFHSLVALAAGSPVSGSGWQPPPQFDPSNHHNALACPYCTPKGSPASGSGWQPISTYEGSDDPVIVWNGSPWLAYEESEGSWFADVEGELIRVVPPPTLWMRAPCSSPEEAPR